MPVPLEAAVAVVAVVGTLGAAVVAESIRRNRRFARKVSPYERKVPPGPDVLDPDDWSRR